MDRGSLVKMSLVLTAALVISACGSSLTKAPSAQRDKIAVINWQQAVQSHPEYQKLQQGKKILQDLLDKRKKQEHLAKAQLGSLDKLRMLRQLSQSSYWQADFDTRMVETREREHKKLLDITQQVEAEVDKELAPRKKSIEDSYQLEIFNMRALLESVRMKPDARADIEAKLKELQRERGRKVMELEAEKHSMMEARLAPHRQELQQRMAEAAADYHAKILQEKQGKEAKEQEMLSAAPKALHNALAIMDREIDKQQEKNDQLQKKIDSDISSQAVKLAHEKGYTIVFNKYKVNITADDITTKVVEYLQKQFQDKK
ncbi:MAG: hypothetical protein SO119_00840 [Phascolarctobacterium sp.]|nr:hypothetical protein [Phascolarctobacterium sp.]